MSTDASGTSGDIKELDSEDERSDDPIGGARGLVRYVFLMSYSRIQLTNSTLIL